MSIKRTIITTIVALALVAVVAPAVTSAVTIDELMAQIGQLQSQLSSLQGANATPVPTGSVACAGVTFTRNLTVGSTGTDVKCLQVLLNTNGFTLAATGAGSPGHETSYFGPRTLVVVKAFQTAHGMIPANQVGPMTRAALNALINGGTYVPPTTTLPAGCTSASGFSPVTGASCATGTVVTPTGTISAMLAASTPAAGALINSQATAGMLDINFVGTGVVTSVTLQRSGISIQNTLSNVYLYDGNVRLTDGYSFNANGQLVINGLAIAVNGSKVISVKADVASDALSYASSIAITLTSYSANGSTVASNVMGNSMMIVTGTAAGATIGTQAVGSASINAGTTGYTFWSAPMVITTRSVLLKTANFRMIGSAPIDALSNIKMFIDGVDTGKVATVATINGSNYAMFDITSSPITLTTGSHMIDMRADVQKGTNRDVTVSVQQASDFTITDPQIGVNIAVAGTPNAAGKISISTGSVTVVLDPTFTSQTNIAGGASNAVIGRFKIHAYGEDVKINTLQVNPLVISGAASAGCTSTSVTGAATGTCGLQNVTLYFNGSQVGSQKNFTQTAGQAENSTTAANELAVYSLGSQMIAPAGQDSILEVRADLLTTGGYAYTSGTVKVILPYQATATTVNYLNAQGQSSQSTLSAPPSAVSTSGLSIGAGGLVVAKSTAYSNQAISPNTQNVKIGSYTIQNQSTSESIRLTSLRVGLAVNANATPVNGTATTYITDVSALRTSDTTGSGSTPIQPTSNDTFSVSDVLAPGASMNLDIFANIGSQSNAAEYLQTALVVSSIGAVDNIAATYPANAVSGTLTSYTTGQIMTLGTGTVASPTLVVSSSTPAQFIASGTNGATNASQATFNFISASGAATINELKFVVDGATTATQVCVGSVCSSTPISGVFDLQGLSLAVPNGGSGLTINAQVSYPPVGTNGLVPGQTSLLSLTYVKYTAGGSTKTRCTTTIGGCDNDLTGTGTGGAIIAKTMTLQGSVPTVTVPTTAGTNLVPGATLQKIGDLTVTASAQGGAIKVNTVTFSVGYTGFTGTPMLTAPIITLAGQTSTLAGSSCAASGTTITCTLGTGYNLGDFLITSGLSQEFNLFATVGGSQNGTAISSISTSLTAAGFLWDDTSYNGQGGAGVDLLLAGTNIFNFPTNSYTNKIQ